MSGGQDSTTCLYQSISEYGRAWLRAIGFNYGQRHVEELEAAKEICADLRIPYKVIDLPILKQLTSNSITDPGIPIDKKMPASGPPNTNVDGRNLIFLSCAAIYAKNHGITDLIMGVSETDYSGYPDCRKNFMDSMQTSLRLSMDYDFNVITPLMRMSKAQIWQLAKDLGCLDIIEKQTITCYNGESGSGCGECPACKLRNEGYNQFINNK